MEVAQEEADERENVQNMRWSDYVMLFLVNGVVAFAMQNEVEEVAFTDNCASEDPPPDRWVILVPLCAHPMAGGSTPSCAQGFAA